MVQFVSNFKSKTSLISVVNKAALSKEELEAKSVKEELEEKVIKFSSDKITFVDYH